MNIALKDVGRLSSMPGTLTLTGSKLWDKPVSQIHPQQVGAFIERMALRGQRDIAESALNIAFSEIRRVAFHRSEPEPAMLSYILPGRF